MFRNSLTCGEGWNIMFHVTPETRARLEAWHGAIRDRDNAICDARDEGASLREIAEIVGLSHTEVRRIIQRGRHAD